MKKLLVIIAVILFISSVSIYLFDKYSYYQVEKINEEKIVTFFNNQDNEEDDNYIGVLEIPSIKLKRGFYGIDSDNNDVDKNIFLAKESTMPDDDNSVLILAAHRGNATNSYFNNLYKLSIGDKINIYYKNNKYTYILKEVYDEKKDGELSIRTYKDKKELVLITCKKGSKDLQSIFIALEETDRL